MSNATHVFYKIKLKLLACGSTNVTSFMSFSLPRMHVGFVLLQVGFVLLQDIAP